jgi:hypothetical protein
MIGIIATETGAACLKFLRFKRRIRFRNFKWKAALESPAWLVRKTSRSFVRKRAAMAYGLRNVPHQM